MDVHPRFGDNKMIEIGDKAKFINLLSDDPDDWFVSAEQFEHIKRLIGKMGTVLNVQVHYKDDGNKEYFLDVEFPRGYVLKRVNSLAFEFVDLSYV